METDEKRLQKVSIGIGMMLASIVVLFLYFVSFLVSPLTASFGSAALTKAVIMIQLRFALPIVVTSTLLGVAGPCLCLAAPRDVKGTGYLLVSVGLNALDLLVIALGMLATLPGWLTGIASSFLPFVSIPFFVLFVRRIAIYLERHDIRKLARGTLILAGMAAVLAAIPWAIVKLKFDLRPYALVGLGLPAVILIVAVLAFLRYLRMLEYARRGVLARSQIQ